MARGLTKLVQSLPGKVGEQATAMWGHAVPAPARTDARPDPSVSGVLVAAAAERKRARLGYRSAVGSVLERTVDPWAVDGIKVSLTGTYSTDGELSGYFIGMLG